MAQLIWAHGEGCNCTQCGNEDHDNPYLMVDLHGEQLTKATLPVKGDSAFFNDQHGKRYVMKEDKGG